MLPRPRQAGYLSDPKVYPDTDPGKYLATTAWSELEFPELIPLRWIDCQTTGILVSCTVSAIKWFPCLRPVQTGNGGT